MNLFSPSEYQKLNEGFLFSEEPYTYFKRVKDHLHNIICNERQISEKSFKQVDEVTEELKVLMEKETIKEACKDFESNNYRAEFCAEYIFQHHLRNGVS